MTILKNKFHSTEIRTNKTPGQIIAIVKRAPWNRSESDKSWLQQINNKLCGKVECCCGRGLAISGKQDNPEFHSLTHVSGITTEEELEKHTTRED